MMSAASSAASRVTMSGGEMRMAVRLQAALADEQAARPARLQEADGRGGVGLEAVADQLQGQHQAAPADLGDDAWFSAIFTRRSFRWLPTSWALLWRSLSRM